MRISLREILRSPHIKPVAIAVTLSVILIALPLSVKTSMSGIGASSVLLPFFEVDRFLLKVDATFKQNRYLNRRLDSLSVLVSSLIEDRIENERLREMMGFNLDQPYQLVPAEVIALSPTSLFKSILIDAGKERGVKTGMPVVSPSGIVGKTVAVQSRSATVQLLLDPSCKVAARVQPSRALGIISYVGGDYLSLANVPIDQTVAVGDSVISSGLGGIFPEGLFIGRVVISTAKEGDLFREILVDPGAEFSILEEVFVIISTPAGK